ncbi:hypothetical protein D0860_06978 [Hortaea werneckii]|uniref:NADH dehydrogenase [ubiquinone] 1 alpha subcomplex subunit 1 n=1 Tax=Hortaea werneckii TaxID=91943 RepID=A0A3M7GQ92_HORWE|nr:hypothetical protein D0860_06978 [Hortaea werneckii]RMZ18986.1 hypothetical protein D0859_17026 [Hortaea werneckii]
MGVPFEALIPYAICLGMFGVSGAALSKIRHMQNGGKRGRHSVDQWDRQSMFFPFPFPGRQYGWLRGGGKEEMENGGTWCWEGSERQSRHERHRGEGGKRKE